MPECIFQMLVVIEGFLVPLYSPTWDVCVEVTITVGLLGVIAKIALCQSLAAVVVEPYEFDCVPFGSVITVASIQNVTILFARNVRREVERTVSERAR